MLTLIVLFQSTLWGQKNEVVVICPVPFQDALKKWTEYRTQQGFKVHVLTPNEPVTLEGVKQQIRALAEKTPNIGAILLIGNAIARESRQSGGSASDSSTSNVVSRIIPAPLVPTKVIDQFGKEKDIASDNVYADLNDDEIPELAIGRLSVNTPEQLETIIRKIIRYETGTQPGSWANRLNFIAGVGGFSPIIDQTLDSASRYILSKTIPGSYNISLTQADWRSPNCPAPPEFTQRTLDRINEGCLFWVYIGHGQRQHLDKVATPIGNYPILAMGDLPRIDCHSGPPIIIFLACYTGALDDPNVDSIAEELVRLENGPIAVYGASRTSMPYGMSTFGLEMIEETFRERGENEPLLLGSIILYGKQQSMFRRQNATAETYARKRGAERGKENRPVWVVLDSIAKLMDPTKDRLDDQRRDHLHMFHLFGDPLLHLPKPLVLSFECPNTAKIGSTLSIRGSLPQSLTRTDSHLFAELVIPVARNVVSTPNRATYDGSAEMNTEYNELYQRANQRVLARVELPIKDGQFSGELPLPTGIAPEEYHLRLFYESPQQIGLGVKPIVIQ